jgi:opacity protein-like surface antigen
MTARSTSIPKLTGKKEIMKSKTLITTAAMALLTATGIKAADQVVASDSQTGWTDKYLYYEHYQETQRPLFSANEFSLDFFGTYINPENNINDIFDTNIRHGSWGGGVGGNYFMTRYLGIGADTSFQTGATRFVDHAVGSLQLRLPIDAAHLAPYVIGGGGYFWSERKWGVDVGPGLDFRFNHNLGIFGDARYVWMNAGGRDQLIFRTGLRVAF